MSTILSGLRTSRPLSVYAFDDIAFPLKIDPTALDSSSSLYRSMAVE